MRDDEEAPMPRRGQSGGDQDPAQSDIVPLEAPSAPVATPASPASVRIIIDCPGAADITDAVWLSIAAEATQAVRGRAQVTSAQLVIDGVALEVYRA